MKQKGIWLFGTGALLALISVALGNSLQSDLRVLPVERLMQESGVEALRLLGFAFGFPLGIGISVLGVVMRSGASARRILMTIGVLLAGVLSAGLVPQVWGRELHTHFFGMGGYSIMLLCFGVVWFWGRYRTGLTGGARNGADLQGIGYLCFALAAWNLCGAATMPSFALEPEMMLAMESQAFAIGQMKTVMVLFVLGWLCTLLGFWQTLKAANPSRQY